MKLYYLLSIAILCSAVALTSCMDNKRTPVRTQPTTPPPYATPSYANPSPATSNFNNEPHYKCPNNCAGGIGDAAGSCPVCGTEMAHNQAYHNQSSPTTTPSTAPVQSATPAQNASGVYHYICSNGCAGGAAAAGTCATCGAALTHNQAYHN